MLKQSSSKQIINQHMAQPPSGGCVLKPAQDWRTTTTTIPAAFRRLCVETGQYSIGTPWKYSQPPSGGCVLKRHFHITVNRRISQPPSGGCVLKRFSGFSHRNISYRQPPSGGCVLKPELGQLGIAQLVQPPSGGCVLKPVRAQTSAEIRPQPPSGGCVLKLTNNARNIVSQNQPPSGGCVLKQTVGRMDTGVHPSRLQAAVC